MKSSGNMLEFDQCKPWNIELTSNYNESIKKSNFINFDPYKLPETENKDDLYENINNVVDNINIISSLQEGQVKFLLFS